jgi:hypothetical protein
MQVRRGEIVIPIWALVLALLVVALVAVALTQASVADELARRAIEEGIIS